MSASDLDRFSTDGVDEAIVDDYVLRRFGIEPREDRSGLFTGRPAPTSDDPEEDDQFEAYMRRHFPAVRQVADGAKE
jgi:hypothetical protein